MKNFSNILNKKQEDGLSETEEWYIEWYEKWKPEDEKKIYKIRKNCKEILKSNWRTKIWLKGNQQHLNTRNQIKRIRKNNQKLPRM